MPCCCQQLVYAGDGAVLYAAGHNGTKGPQVCHHIEGQAMVGDPLLGTHANGSHLGTPHPHTCGTQEGYVTARCSSGRGRRVTAHDGVADDWCAGWECNCCSPALGWLQLPVLPTSPAVQPANWQLAPCSPSAATATSPVQSATPPVLFTPVVPPTCEAGEPLPLQAAGAAQCAHHHLLQGAQVPVQVTGVGGEVQERVQHQLGRQEGGRGGAVGNTVV